MSYYYNYFIGYRNKEDNKLYPLGPFTDKNKMQYALYRSRSYASDLYTEFYPVNEEELSDDLIKMYKHKNIFGEEELSLKYLPYTKFKDFSKDFIKSGYFLKSSVNIYLQNKDEYDYDSIANLFYDYLSPEVYACKLVEEKDNPPVKLEDYEYEEITEYPASDFMYFSYPNKFCREYEVFIICTVAEILSDYNYNDDELVIFLSQG